MLSKAIEYFEQEGLLITQVQLMNRDGEDVYTICVKNEERGFTFQFRDKNLFMLDTKGRFITEKTIRNFNLDQTSRLEVLQVALQR